MLQYKNIFLIILLSAVCYLLSVNIAYADQFNPNLIISDEEILDSTTMSLDDIQSFLESKGSYLARYTGPNADGILKKASEIIYDAAVNNFDCDDANLSDNPDIFEKQQKCQPIAINPEFLLVLLQKEQSLVEETAPTQRQLDWATGYGCPDNQACNLRWQGFGKQVNSAALQFFDYITNPHRYTYKVGYTYSVENTGRPPTTIMPVNNATAALYNYTPHVYWGNYNFHKIWLRYFTFNYLNGSLLQAKGEPGVWLIQNGKKRPFLTKGALTSRFDVDRIIQVNKADLDRYLEGGPIKFPQYSLIRSPRGTVFLLVDDKRRGFTSAEAFRKIGYHPDEVIEASWDDINVYQEGVAITATTSYPMGALLQDNTTGGVYYVYEGTKAPLWDAVLLKTRFKRLAIFPISPEKLASYQTVEPVVFPAGELLKSPISPAVYITSENKKHAFISGKAFEGIGYKWENIITVSQKIIDLYTDGDPITEEALEIEEEVATSTLEVDVIN